MARYIDADKLKGMFNGARPVGCAMHQIIDEVPTADVAPRAEVAREIFEEIENLMREWFDFFRQDNDIRESCAIMAALSQITELKNKYAEGQK